MDTQHFQVIPLQNAVTHPVSVVGGKARNLSRCLDAGFTVPDGFVVPSDSYRDYVEKNRLRQTIDMEIYRKPFDDMRWEEIWDIALRIRSAFLKGVMPITLERAIREQLERWPETTRFAVRSSSPAEDSRESSYAGIHESYLNIEKEDVLRHVRLVWASLWSDRSLLYRQELTLDSSISAMAVLVQPMIEEPVSGLAFTADPATGKTDAVLVEVISGSLDKLVDNLVEPVRIRLDRESGIPQPGKTDTDELMKEADLILLCHHALALEGLLGVPVDIEWTGQGDRFTVLQVRPVTGLSKDENGERSWYLSLTPGRKKLLALTDRVEHELIPALEAEVQRFDENTESKRSGEELAARLDELGNSYRTWKKIYWDEFIPFAHGIRNFGTYYNDLVQPEDPYAFMQLLRSEDLLARIRDRQMQSLARQLRDNVPLQNVLETWSRSPEPIKGSAWLSEPDRPEIPAEFLRSLRTFMSTQLNLYYENTGLADDLRMLFGILASMARNPGNAPPVETADDPGKLEEQFLKAAGPARQDEAASWLRIGRLSWRLRDDDNILLGRLEHQLLQTMREAMAVLVEHGLLDAVGDRVVLEDWEALVDGLRNHTAVSLSPAPQAPVPTNRGRVQVRQLVGQPSSPGTATGKARVLRSLEEFREVVPGEILVFDAVQPQMTFVISLAGAIVERRGGMLVHSSIIARELGIPAVNGVSRATDLLRTGDLITVNGDLGLVIIGKPEFDLERMSDGG